MPTRGGDWYDGGFWQGLYLHRWGVNNEAIYATWEYLYRTVILCNGSLERIQDFAEKHPDVVKAFAKSAIDAQQPYLASPDEWLKQPTNLEKLSRLSGVPESDVPGLVKGNTYLTPQQQTAELTGPVNKAIIDTAQFLKEQGKVPAVANDYSQYVTSRFVQ